MRASSAASTRVGAGAPAASALSRACSAQAGSVPIGTTGKPRPNARPCATPVAVRRPVNEPGPAPNAIASQSASVKPASSSSSRMAGSTRVLETAPVSSWRTQMRGAVEAGAASEAAIRATEQNSVEVSMARSTVCVMADIVMRHPAGTGVSKPAAGTSRSAGAAASRFGRIARPRPAATLATIGRPENPSETPDERYPRPVRAGAGGRQATEREARQPDPAASLRAVQARRAKATSMATSPASPTSSASTSTTPGPR